MCAIEPRLDWLFHLRRVTLYGHGVGYFERQGKVDGNQQVTFTFDAAQLNDVLKSLVVLDLNKGKISIQPMAQD